jgi:hypothetical protein
MYEDTSIMMRILVEIEACWREREEAEEKSEGSEM